jgi:beta-lactamase regulating signal transducer with metallopeptidase domain
VISPLAERTWIWIIDASVQGAALVVLVLAVRVFTAGRLHPRVRYALWVVVMARLALPVAPSTSLGGHLSPPPSAGAALLPLVAPAPSAAPAGSALGSDSRKVAMGDVCLAVWLGVAGILLSRMAADTLRVAQLVRSRRVVTREDVLELLEDCKQEMGVHTPISVVVSPAVATPALLGFVRPRLVLPEWLLTSLTRQELRDVFLHEVAHVRRLDIVLHWIASVLAAVHWFNPLVALALRRMRADREQATDALVLSLRSAADTRGYGETLLRLLEIPRAQPRVLPAGAVGVLESAGEIERRIVMIARHTAGAYRWSPLATALVAALVVVGIFTTPTDTQARTAHANEAPSPTGAAAAMNTWLSLVDQGQYGASWDQASAPFRASITRTDWEKAVTSARTPLGQLLSRKVTSTSRKRTSQGDFFVLETEANFQKAGRAVETVSLQLDPDGAWRAAGYFVRPRPSADKAPEAAQTAVTAWLQLVDQADYSGSWAKSSPALQAAVTAAQWETAAKGARGPLGALRSRRMVSATPQDNVPGGPAGKYVVFESEAAFEHRSAVETTTVHLEEDGYWRVVGYFVR